MITTVAIGITNRCNLACPSCPGGKTTWNKTAPKLRCIEPLLFEKIIERLVSLYGNSFQVMTSLFSEPLLHPDIDALLHILEKYGLGAFISSNLNIQRDFTSIFSIRSLKELLVSISAVTPEKYQINHRGGNIELVRKNLANIVEAEKHPHCKISVAFHLYEYNREDGAYLAQYCADNGLQFLPYPGYIFHDPAIVQALAEGKDITTYLDNDAVELFPHLLTPALMTRETHPQYADLPCPELENSLRIDGDGSVYPCCFFSSEPAHRLGSLFELTPDDIKNAQRTSPFCAQCKKSGFFINRYIKRAITRSIDNQHVPEAQKDLDRILSKVPDVLNKKLLSLSRDEHPVVLYGVSQISIVLYSLLIGNGFSQVFAIDDDPKKQSKTLPCGMPVYSYDAGKRLFSKETTVILCMEGMPQANVSELKEKVLQGGAGKVFKIHEFIDFL